MRSISKSMSDQRGMALLMVLVTVAVLSAMIVDFAYQNRINLDMAANTRDRVRAYYLARSAMNFARLILHFQGQIDRMTGGSLKLYDLLPIESDLAKALTSGEMGKAFGMEGLELDATKGFGDFEGRFFAQIDDESAKININSLDGLPSVSAPVTAQLLALIGQPRYKTMFEAPDADDQYNTPADVAISIHDWIDADNSMDTINPNAVIAEPFSQTSVFLPGTSSEDSRYDMLSDPYRNKNNPFLTVDELYMIRGVGDHFMEEFADRLTVYSDPNQLINLSAVKDPLGMLTILCMQPQNLAMCTEQGLPQLLEVLALFFEFRNLMFPMTPNAEQINMLFQSQGVALDPYFLKNVAPFSDTFSIKAIGELGDEGEEVRVTIKAVVKNTLSGQEILYWRIM